MSVKTTTLPHNIFEAHSPQIVLSEKLEQSAERIEHYSEALDEHEEMTSELEVMLGNMFTENDMFLEIIDDVLESSGVANVRLEGALEQIELSLEVGDKLDLDERPETKLAFGALAGDALLLEEEDSSRKGIIEQICENMRQDALGSEASMPRDVREEYAQLINEYRGRMQHYREVVLDNLMTQSRDTVLHIASLEQGLLNIS